MVWKKTIALLIKKAYTDGQLFGRGWRRRGMQWTLKRINDLLSQGWET